MNILPLYVLKISGKVFDNQVKMPYTPTQAKLLATSLQPVPAFQQQLFC